MSRMYLSTTVIAFLLEVGFALDAEAATIGWQMSFHYRRVIIIAYGSCIRKNRKVAGENAFDS